MKDKETTYIVIAFIPILIIIFLCAGGWLFFDYPSWFPNYVPLIVVCLAGLDAAYIFWCMNKFHIDI